MLKLWPGCKGDDCLGRFAVLITGVQPRTGLRKDLAPIDVPSCHLIGEADFAKRVRSLQLLAAASGAARCTSVYRHAGVAEARGLL